jgi:hypothetical protein
VNCFVYQFLTNPLLSEVFVRCGVLALIDAPKDGHTDKFVGSSTEY